MRTLVTVVALQVPRNHFLLPSKEDTRTLDATISNTVLVRVHKIKIFIARPTVLIQANFLSLSLHASLRARHALYLTPTPSPCPLLQVAMLVEGRSSVLNPVQEWILRRHIASLQVLRVPHSRGSSSSSDLPLTHPLTHTLP